MTIPTTRPTVLVVDDDEAARTSMVRILERAGYGVRSAAEPGEALRIARGGGIDVAVVDVFLPLMSGLVLAHSLSRTLPDLRILYVSGFAREETLTDMAGIEPRVGFLGKPFEARELEEAVRTVLSSR